MPLRNPAENQKSFVRLVHTRKGGKRGEQLPGRLWVDWADPVYGYTCPYCLNTDHLLCNLKEPYSGGPCKCNLCQHKHRKAKKPKAAPKPPPIWLAAAKVMRRTGASYREIGEAVHVDHSAIAKRAVREGWA